MAVEPLLGTRAQRAFMITRNAHISAEAFVVIAMVASTFGITLPCYLALFILAEYVAPLGLLFELALAYDALRLRNVIQLLGIVGFHCALIVFSALQVHETKAAIVPCPLLQCQDNPNFLWDKVMPFLVVAPCIIAASWILIMYWIKALYEEFGWVIFHVVGANPKLKSMFQYYQIFICLLKFDFFCFVGVTMQLLIVVLAANSAEFGVTIAAIPVVVILLAGCAYAVQREIKWLMTASLVLMVAAMTYFYKLVRFYEPSSEQQYLSTRATLTVFTIFAFLLLLASFIVGVKCFYDFGKGLHDSKTQDVSVSADQRYGSFPKAQELDSAYSTGGAALQPQISIE
ncbi:hypothetical protein EV401DRAFT_2059749 [Pisolithus croceorrhizus]|nr:hypothetical protein EV401DRAFT_2059749 [Pisolithus croceorrhizus]